MPVLPPGAARPGHSFRGADQVDWQHLFGVCLVATIPVLILFALIE